MSHRSFVVLGLSRPIALLNRVLTIWEWQVCVMRMIMSHFVPQSGDIYARVGITFVCHMITL